MLKTFAELDFPGRLIAVEGLDGSGKSTQIYLLKRWMENQGLKVYFSEWNSSELVKAATSKGKKRELLTPTTFSLIHATDFGDRYERQLVPLLRAGYLVLCDRYVFTAFARDAVRGCDPAWLRNLYDFATRPDLSLYFRVDIDTSVARIMGGRTGLHPVVIIVAVVTPGVDTIMADAGFAVTSGSLLLIGMGLLHLGISAQVLRVTIGLMTVLAGFEILYATVEGSILVSALLAVINLGLALVG